MCQFSRTRRVNGNAAWAGCCCCSRSEWNGENASQQKLWWSYVKATEPIRTRRFSLSLHTRNPWQKKETHKKKILFPEPLTDIVAFRMNLCNPLCSSHTNHICGVETNKQHRPPHFILLRSSTYLVS